PVLAGPTPIYVRMAPAGAALDLDALTQHVVRDVLSALLDPADEGPWDLLMQAAVARPADDERAADPLDELVTLLTERSSSRVLLTPDRARGLAARLIAVVGPAPAAAVGRAA
ncbi:hypothetical protein ACZ91_64670, partial [Streptomyces regensis]